MSEEKEIGKEQDIHENEEAQNVKEVAAEEKIELTWEDKYNDINDKFLRLYAEFDNFRRRTNKEKSDLIINAGSSVLKDMLPIMDDFERAILNNEKSEDLNGVKEGFSLIYHKFKNTLESKGLKPMISKGEVFDSELHEAIANVPAPSKKEIGKVIDDVEKGYLMNEKVIRFAKVVVGQ
ncbi:MAG: nucleotide exchange factor GrpE [Flavobacteriia bacterium]|nr:nucleotide exchange factor GrpE [Flavobacteriia bacterium]